jgi:hypothetical protein
MRKLDALFAERVLGLKVHPTLGYEEHNMLPPIPLRPYTSSLDAAWEGVERCARGEDPAAILTFYRHPDQLMVELCDRGRGRATDNPALAIVLACLRAVGCSEEDIAAASQDSPQDANDPPARRRDV